MKKTLALVLTIAICATMALGGTLAYLTDTEEAVNIMTMGRVDIDLHEKQRGDNGLEDFQDGKTLLPIVGSAQGDKDEYGLPTAANYVDKIITVSNKELSTDAWVRLLIAFPQGMDAESAADMPLHWNSGNKYVGDEKQYDPDGYAQDWKAVDTGEDAEIDGIKYNIYSYTYQHALRPGYETDTAAIVGFYLDARVDWDDETEEYFLLKKDGTKEIVTGIGADGSVRIPVVAQAVQAAGFETADMAFEASNMPINPWAGKSYSGIVMVRTVDELVAAASTPGVVATMANDIHMEEQLMLAGGAVLDGNGHTLSSSVQPDATGYTIPAVHANNGEVRNINVIGSGRGVGTRGALQGNLSVNGLYSDNGSYALHVGQGNGYSLIVENSILAGWTSYGKGFASVLFENVQFNKNSVESEFNGVRAYSNTTFRYCDFATGVTLDIDGDATEIVLEGCTINTQPITQDNLADLLAEDSEANLIKIK